MDSDYADKLAKKEATTLKFRALPSFAELSAWKLTVVDTILACANRNDDTRLLSWWRECETKTCEELAYCPKEFSRLDRKITEALNNVASSGQLGGAIYNKKRQLDLKSLPPLRGRQIYWMILNDYRTQKHMDLHHSTLDLEKLRWMGRFR